MTERTDTERLDWLLDRRNSMLKVQGTDERGWSVLDQSNGLTFVARGLPTSRAAIDTAMDMRP